MLRVHRVLVAGGSEMSEDAVTVAEHLGRMLMKTDCVLVTGGFASRLDAKAADHVVAQAALEALGSDADAAGMRIETVVPEIDKRPRHQIGRVITVKEANTNTRRFSMVISSDAVIAFGGDTGTPEIIKLAFFAKKPLILFPSLGGAAADCWKDYRSELKERLRLTETELKILEKPPDTTALIETCHTLLVRALRPGCFLAIKFDNHPVPGVSQTIGEAVDALGYQVVNLQRENFTGSAIDAIWHQIDRSALVIADLTGDSPNVYYEVGIAHALRKPTVLLIRSQDGKVPANVPFDLSGQQILPYLQPESLVTLLKERLLHAEHYLREPRQA
jgi:hypothetical protein